MFLAGCVDVDAGIAFIGTERIAQHTGTLVAQVVLAIVKSGEPLASFQQNDTESGLGKFLGDNPASGSAADHDRIYVLQ